MAKQQAKSKAKKRLLLEVVYSKPERKTEPMNCESKEWATVLVQRRLALSDHKITRATWFNGQGEKIDILKICKPNKTK